MGDDGRLCSTLFSQEDGKLHKAQDDAGDTTNQEDGADGDDECLGTLVLKHLLEAPAGETSKMDYARDDESCY